MVRKGDVVLKDYYKAKLDGMFAENITFTSCGFMHCDFTGAKFESCVFINCDFSFSNIRSDQISSCRLKNCTFK
jgi:uncharacterized protein YjbI with pentapeptide repeats